MIVVVNTEMIPEYEKFIENQEQIFIDKIVEILKENKGKDLEPLEHSTLDAIYGYVKQIIIFQHTRNTLERADKHESMIRNSEK